MPRESLQSLRARVRSGPPYDEALLGALRSDGRAGAQALHAACLRRQERAGTEAARLDAMLVFEREAGTAGFTRIAGVDEAGRGPLAGPLVAAAVVLAEPVPGLDDSKRLTAEQRNALFEQLIHGGHWIGVASVEPAEIDRFGIQAANYAAMDQAVKHLAPPPDFLLVDGFEIHGSTWPQKRLVKGDQRSLSIAAASVIAKVTRDRIMEKLHVAYPAYGFAAHKGYGTESHLRALEHHGPCPVHRRSFAPIAESVHTPELF
ncbi:MAG TPA: ribonuclease HII [Candidatus Hydrogenedentes bacterium]|nr:ribonuclease HII [Candidatus Hydrogenedentota bacterium]